MRIVNRSEFLKLPEGVLYSKYAPCYFEALCIKGESWDNDFCSQQIADAVACKDSAEFDRVLFKSESTGASFDMDFDCWGRDGCFDEDQLFAVWEEQDLLQLKSRLERVVPA